MGQAEGAMQRREPLVPCCDEVTIQVVEDVFEAYPWMARRPNTPPRVEAPVGGFAVTAWNGKPAVSSWFHVRKHIVEPRPLNGWSDLLHAIVYPCHVIESFETGRHGERRWAAFRLRPANEATFRCAVLQPEGDAGFRIITAFDEPSFTHWWFPNMADADKRYWTCKGYALRRRDVHYYPADYPLPARWSSAMEIPPMECCELAPGCFYRPGSIPSKRR